MSLVSDENHRARSAVSLRILRIFLTARARHNGQRALFPHRASIMTRQVMSRLDPRFRAQFAQITSLFSAIA